MHTIIRSALYQGSNHLLHWFILNLFLCAIWVKFSYFTTLSQQTCDYNITNDSLTLTLGTNPLLRVFIDSLLYPAPGTTTDRLSVTQVVAWGVRVTCSLLSQPRQTMPLSTLRSAARKPTTSTGSSPSINVLCPHHEQRYIYNILS